MLNHDSNDLAKQACLKQSYGAELTQEEQDLLDQFLESAEGQQYRAESSEMQRLLGELATVEVRPSIDSAAMVAAFEEMAREELRASRRRFPLYLMLTSGIGLLTGGLSLQSGQEDKVLFGWTMIVFAALCAILFVAIWNKDGAWLEDPELLMRMEEERAEGESQAAIVVWSLIGVGLLTVLGIGVAKAGGVFAITTAIVVSIIVYAIGKHYEKKKRARHQELWDWWDDRAARD